MFERAADEFATRYAEALEVPDAPGQWEMDEFEDLLSDADWQGDADAWS